ncbi:hypothetical protein HH213_20240 [Duganella dendranthematis]|uniref:Uncharacterized protein n=1 Tax=Duganella dendranthematis TaxID=2728021 RepID=A0ABX6MD31_9BURK|nr:hypothetical protein [Duganella dendranthematis]QJD92218.1 hypothetical protein HH213_20240 [Duganella dendranthematis]
MQIYFSTSIFSSESPRKILEAIEEAYSQSHQIVIEDTLSPVYLTWLDFCKNHLQEEDIGELLELQFTSSIFVESKRQINVVTNPTPKSNEVTLLTLKNDILRTFFIYVENGRADKRFLFSMLGLEIKKDMERLIRSGALTFENCGGITELTEKLRDDAANRNLLNLRAFACFDSDAIAPDTPSKQAEKATKVCEHFEIPHYRLQRRAIENYIPIPAIELYVAEGNEDLTIARKKILRAFSRLTQPQQEHFHMKSGLSVQHGEVFDSIIDPDKSVLQTGFGDHLSSCYEKGYVTTEHLKNSSAWPEIQELSKMVMEYL